MSFRVINQINSGLTKEIIGRELELIKNIRTNLVNEIDESACGDPSQASLTSQRASSSSQRASSSREDREDREDRGDSSSELGSRGKLGLREISGAELVVKNNSDHDNEFSYENSDEEDELQYLAKVITQTIQTPRYSSVIHRNNTPRPLNSIKSQKFNKIKDNFKYQDTKKGTDTIGEARLLREQARLTSVDESSCRDISLFETPRTNTKTNKGVPIRPKKFIKLTYNNPKYILKKDELYDIFSGETHNKILDYTGEDVKGKIILPYEDSPKCAREIISLFGLDTNIQTTEIEESQSIYFSINRQVSGSCGELDIELLGNEN